MTLDQWLQQTLQVFPENVQQHLRQEYTAHYQDHLDAGGQPDALALFGPPAESQKRLKKTYLTQAMLDQPQRLTLFLAGLVIFFSLSWLKNALDDVERTYLLMKIALPVVSLLIFAGLWVMTRRMVAVRRSSIRNLSAMFLNYVMMLPFVFLSPSTNTMLLWSTLITMLCLLYQAFDTDRRIRRTLRPGSAERP
ncbi:hypothetical protein [Deinococcus ruber]|uniref:Uncharacterized protein n=1 Tax=Deinococcus ruber TaxID=1848197 RepID=A0A918CCY7_9DEIO|nr:hypothetical protein [Deinococcus ruber]GGR16456.1 hypothetical protein GCM10008957_31380 [Deinococcus ruber]